MKQAEQVDSHLQAIPGEHECYPSLHVVTV